MTPVIELTDMSMLAQKPSPRTLRRCRLVKDRGGFVWSPDYLVGHDIIDGEHQQIFALSGLVCQAIESGKKGTIVEQSFCMLEIYTRNHFAREEEILSGNGSPHLDDHRFEHDFLREQLADLRAQCAAGDRTTRLKAIADWLEKKLLPHIVHNDRDAFGESLTVSFR
jgi:hemerythrin-like metal-binding protein